MSLVEGDPACLPTIPLRLSQNDIVMHEGYVVSLAFATRHLTNPALSGSRHTYLNLMKAIDPG